MGSNHGVHRNAPAYAHHSKMFASAAHPAIPPSTWRPGTGDVEAWHRSCDVVEKLDVTVLPSHDPLVLRRAVSR